MSRPRGVTTAGATMAIQIVELAAQLAVAMVVARLLGPAAFGRFAVATGLAGMAAMVLQPGTTDMVMQLVLDGVDANAVVGAAVHRLRRGVMRAMAVMIVGAVVVGVGTDDIAVVGLMGLTLVGNGLAAIMGAVVVARGRTVPDLAVVVVGKAVLLLGAIVGAVLGALWMVMLAFVAAALVTIVGRSVVLRGVQAWPPRYDDDVIDLLRRRGRRLSFGVMAGAVAARADTMALQRLTVTTQVGLYAAAFRIIAGSLALVQAAMLAMHPQLSQAVARRHTGRLRLMVAAVMTVVMVVALLPLTGVSGWLATIFGASFAQSAPVLDVLWWVLACQILSTFSARALLAAGRAGAMAPWQVFIALLAVPLQVVGVVLGGAMGAATSTLVVEGALAMGHLWQWRHLAGGLVPRRETHGAGTGLGKSSPCAP